MRMPNPGFLTLAVVLALGQSACSDGSTAPTTGLSASEAQDVADVVTTDTDALLDGSTVVVGSGVQLAPGIERGSPPPCAPAITPASPSNGDGDAIPDSVRFDFTGCAFTRGPFEFTVSGLIDVLDPAVAPDDFGIRFVFTGFSHTRTLTGTNRTRTAEFNGARQVTGNADAVNHLITNFETRVTLGNRGTVSHLKNWNGTFTADVAGTIAPGQPLPNGILNVAGTSEWSRGANEVFAMTITTSGLHYDSGCTVAPKFDAGTVTAVVDRQGVITTVVVEHTACGQFTVTRS